MLTEYEKKLPRALQRAGYTIQSYFKERSYLRERGPNKEIEFDISKFRWIQTSLQMPAFQHLCFGLKNQVYSVLILLMDSQRRLHFREQDVDNQLRECERNNMIPSIIILNDTPDMLPVYQSFNFPVVSTYRLLGKDKDIRPSAFDLECNVVMSPWEIHSFGIQVVRDDIESNGGKILSFCDVIGVSPNIWFEKKGKISTVFVSVKSPLFSTDFKSVKLNPQTKEKYKKYGLYKAEVDIGGRDSQLIRGKPNYVGFNGLKEITVDAIKTSLDSVTLRDDIDEYKLS